MTWEELEKEIQVLASKIDIHPDIIIGVVRGGLIPARLLSNKLRVNDMYSLTVKKLGEERKVTSEVLEDLTGKKILLIEDVLETGKSLIAAKRYLETKGAIIQTACLYTMPVSELKPDYYLKEVIEAVKFPWE